MLLDSGNPNPLSIQEQVLFTRDLVMSRSVSIMATIHVTSLNGVCNGISRDNKEPRMQEAGLH